MARSVSAWDDARHEIGYSGKSLQRASGAGSTDISRTGLKLLPTGTLKLHSRVSDQLGLAIVRGDFKPGDTLPSEVQLCEMLGVSRTAMREAVRALAAKGLIDSRPKRGTLIREPEHWNHLDPDLLRWTVEVAETETYLKKMFQLRRATEPEAAALAAVAATEADQAKLSAAFDAMVAAGADNDRWVAGDLDFHKAIYLATHNEYFWPIGQLFGFGLRPMFALLAQGSHRPRAIAEHGDILRAILERKPDMARAAVVTLLGNAAHDVDVIRNVEFSRTV